MEPLTIEERFGQLKKAKERPQNSHPKIQKIQRVANHLRNRKYLEKHYSPKLVSIGPIHHGKENLRLGEKYKLMWAAKYIQNSRRNPKCLHKKIGDNIEELKGLFVEDVLTGMSSLYHSEGFRSLQEKLSWVLFVDGCALLHILEKAKLNKAGEMNVKVDELVLVMMDVLLLENQIPYLVLKLLWTDHRVESALKHTMRNFLKCHHFRSENNNSISEYSPAHLLDLQRRIILPAESCPKIDELETSSTSSISIGAEEDMCAPQMVLDEYHVTMEEGELNTENNSRKNSSDDMVTFRNIQELSAAGIRLKSSKTRRPRDISFSHGWLVAELTLPEIVVDDTTAATFLNLIAYEMCQGFENDYGICSFTAFMDSLIDHAEDVKALRSAGILLNSLGSDEEVAKLFNIISSDLVPDARAYSKVRAQIETYYKIKWKTWIAQGYHTYFSNPWAIIAFLAALLALVLTFVQTWFAIHPAD